MSWLSRICKAVVAIAAVATGVGALLAAGGLGASLLASTLTSVMPYLKAGATIAEAFLSPQFQSLLGEKAEQQRKEVSQSNLTYDEKKEALKAIDLAEANARNMAEWLAKQNTSGAVIPGHMTQPAENVISYICNKYLVALEADTVTASPQTTQRTNEAQLERILVDAALQKA